jgi:nucleotide-binding universal stress UspA family protein
MFERLVVGVTERKTAKEAARQAEQLARTFDAELHLVTAFDDKQSERAPDQAETLLHNMAMASASKVHLHTCPGDPAEAICRIADEVGADLIVVGNQGLAGSGRFTNSVPAAVSRQATCAVLILNTM